MQAQEFLKLAKQTLMGRHLNDKIIRSVIWYTVAWPTDQLTNSPIQQLTHQLWLTESPIDWSTDWSIDRLTIDPLTYWPIDYHEHKILDHIDLVHMKNQRSNKRIVYNIYEKSTLLEIEIEF